MTEVMIFLFGLWVGAFIGMLIICIFIGGKGE